MGEGRGRGEGGERQGGDLLLVDRLHQSSRRLPKVDEGHGSRHSQSQVLAEVGVGIQAPTLCCFLYHHAKYSNDHFA